MNTKIKNTSHNYYNLFDALLIILAFLLFLIGLYFWQGSSIFDFNQLAWTTITNNKSQIDFLGHLKVLNDGVSLKKSDEINWRQTVQSDQLYNGDKIFTNDLGLAEIESSWGQIIVENNTLIKLINKDTVEATGSGSQIILNNSKNVNILLPSGEKIELSNSGAEKAKIEIETPQGNEKGIIKIISGEKIALKSKTRVISLKKYELVKFAQKGQDKFEQIEKIKFKIKYPSYREQVEIEASVSGKLELGLINLNQENQQVKIKLSNRPDFTNAFELISELESGLNKIYINYDQLIKGIHSGAIFISISSEDTNRDKSRFTLKINRPKEATLAAQLPLDIKWNYPSNNEEYILYAENGKNLSFSYQMKNESQGYLIRLNNNREQILFEKQYQKTASGEYQFEIPLDFSKKEQFGKLLLSVLQGQEKKQISFNLINGDLILRSPKEDSRIVLPKPHMNINFKWQELGIAGKYLFQITQDASFKKVIATIKSKNSSAQYNFKKLGKYYWRVLKISNNKEVIYGKKMTIFVVPNAPLSAPNIKHKVLQLKKIKKQKKTKSVLNSFLDLILDSANAEIPDKEKTGPSRNIKSIKVPESIATIDWVLDSDASSTLLEIYNSTGDSQILRVEVNNNYYHWQNAIPGEYIWRITYRDHWGRLGEKSSFAKLIIKSPITNSHSNSLKTSLPLSIRKKSNFSYTPYKYNYTATSGRGKVTVDGNVIEGISFSSKAIYNKFFICPQIDYSRGVVFKGRAYQKTFNIYSIGGEISYKINSNPAWYLLSGLKLSYDNLLDFDIPSVTNSTPNASPLAKSISMPSAGPLISFIFSSGETIIQPQLIYQVIGAKGPLFIIDFNFKQKWQLGLNYNSQSYKGTNSDIKATAIGLRLGLLF